VSGGTNNVPITKEGRAQAKKAGQDLKNKKVELIVCSPMIRTLETATIIANEIGYDTDKIITNPILIERAYGIYDGGPNEKYKNDLSSGVVHESVETEEEMFYRFKKALGWLSDLKEDNILVVSHGGARRAIHVIKNDLHHSEMYKIDSFPNGGIYEFNL
jgi:broad specificity phosphatase PhoE